MLRIFPLLIFVLLPTFTNAQNVDDLTYGSKQNYPILHELNWINEQFLIKQRMRVEELTRKNFGKSLLIGKRNLPILQRLINENIIEKDDTITLQALGVVLGDVFVESHKKLQWKVYEDELGKSHAVCVEKTKQCIFPITMLSKRMELELEPDVNNLFQKGLDAMQPFLPKLPFSSE